MKHFTTILCVTFAIATASCHIISYIGGRQGTHLAIGAFPAQIVPMLAAVFSLASLFVCLVFALITRRPARRAAAALTISLLFFMVGFAISPAKVFQAGFRHRITLTVSVDELRGIARVCHLTLPVDGRLPGPQKTSLWNESEHRAQWKALTGATALGKLDSWLTVHNGTDTVTISWGGALVGHWGLIIQTDSKGGTGDIASDIRTFISSD